ncbi:hypothetical protein FGO68_gene4973 [Halteria grandinella]|uniref:Uncharacterized protein n=1 Tax=Halteria grandinella TaxID=5974 RepID=A0A8J8NIV5_HALGN|nr:hypothetical protein FGO68_gene4973 [Halteria grandinella]
MNSNVSQYIGNQGERISNTSALGAEASRYRFPRDISQYQQHGPPFCSNPSFFSNYQPMMGSAIPHHFIQPYYYPHLPVNPPDQNVREGQQANLEDEEELDRQLHFLTIRSQGKTAKVRNWLSDDSTKFLEKCIQKSIQRDRLIKWTEEKIHRITSLLNKKIKNLYKTEIQRTGVGKTKQKVEYRQVSRWYHARKLQLKKEGRYQGDPIE